jgi:hypothetical protein
MEAESELRGQLGDNQLGLLLILLDKKVINESIKNQANLPLAL